MGNILEYKCKKCRKMYSVSIGIGYLQPMICENTVKDIVAGKYGKEWKNAYEKGGENLAVTAEKVVYCCEKCGNWENKTDITLYAPNKKSENNRGHFIMRGDPGFHVYKQFVPTCSQCCGEMKELENVYELLCPKCGTVNRFGPIILTD